MDLYGTLFSRYVGGGGGGGTPEETVTYEGVPPLDVTSNGKAATAYEISGDRYIDFAAAVGASASGVWYTGMLSNDNVHPSEAGAIALYHRAIADCPELTFTNP